MEAITRTFLLLALVVQNFGDDRHISCGSAMRLRHAESKFFLKSAAQKYQSGQQASLAVVTLDKFGDLLWQIHAGHNTTCATGAPIRCNDVVRFTHLNTGRNLRSHRIPAPLSRHNDEVSGFGDDGRGDASDNWRVECWHREGSTETSEQLWTSATLVRFVHVDTMAYLTGSQRTKFTPANCPNCPIHGELEVSDTSHNSGSAVQSSIFGADDGVYLRP